VNSVLGTLTIFGPYDDLEHIVREESQSVSITAEARLGVELPDTPYALWARGELDDHLHLPDRLFRVEVIGGEIVVSPAPALEHGGIVQDIADSVAEARFGRPGFPWKCIQGTGMDLVGIRDGYVPDLMILEAETLREARQAGVRYLVPDQVELVIELTSPSNANDDRKPAALRPEPTKWNGYARAEIPYYLLVDRDPKAARTTLFSIPDQGTGAYLHEDSWAFGETVVLPDPIGLEIPTVEWTSWY
jgi:Uma2 family endonuclease